ncbi:class C sortase [Bifidobacterium biavatii]|nr:class C sortase [Bifidobacterium biavatii]
MLTGVAVSHAYAAAELDQASQQAAMVPSSEQDQMIRQAREYNRKLAKNGQYVLGEAQDPFLQLQGEQRPASETDTAYVKALNTDGDGTMGSISIPKINVDLPILHGTSLDTLDHGAGHMYGTSLPVGGTNTHSVISAHNGMTKALMFTNLGEMREGDAFYLHIAGHTFAYKIDRVTKILPNDFSKLTIRKGEDRVTLMTCWPYGRNTERLLVSGLRASMPDQVPYEQDVQRQNPIIADRFALAATGLMPCAIGYAGWTGWTYRRAAKKLPCKHKA